MDSHRWKIDGDPWNLNPVIVECEIPVVESGSFDKQLWAQRESVATEQKRGTLNLFNSLSLVNKTDSHSLKKLTSNYYCFTQDTIRPNRLFNYSLLIIIYISNTQNRNLICNICRTFFELDVRLRNEQQFPVVVLFDLFVCFDCEMFHWRVSAARRGECWCCRQPRYKLVNISIKCPFSFQRYTEVQKKGPFHNF